MNELQFHSNILFEIQRRSKLILAPHICSFIRRNSQLFFFIMCAQQREVTKKKKWFIWKKIWLKWNFKTKKLDGNKAFFVINSSDWKLNFIENTWCFQSWLSAWLLFRGYILYTTSLSLWHHDVITSYWTTK